jgi:hypothetical protein
MGNLTTALVIVMSINVILFLGQIAALEVNPEGNQFFNYSGSMLSRYDSGDYVLNDTDVNTQLPGLVSGVDPEQGNFWTDPIGTLKSWLLESTGISYLWGIVTAPANFLKALGLPAAFSFSLGALWYALTLFLIVSWIMGRDT